MVDHLTIHELEPLRNREHVFRDRRHAGQILTEILETACSGSVQVLGIPNGGVPVAAEIARRLAIPLDLAVSCKITFPWNRESGYGAVAFDGTCHINRELVRNFGLTPATVDKGIAMTREKVRNRLQYYRRGRPFPDLSTGPVILVDDGAASGITLQVTVSALRKCGASELIIAVPTGYIHTVQLLANDAEKVYCPNISHDMYFAVADAYESWQDVKDEEVIALLSG